MGKVAAQLAMSLDGFIADPDDGCDELFGFYGSGDVPLKLSAGFPELRVSRTTADLLVVAASGPGRPWSAAASTTSPTAGTGIPAARCRWVILGAGVPWLAGSRGPVRLSDPEVLEDQGVTHLRYAVLR